MRTSGVSLRKSAAVLERSPRRRRAVGRAVVALGHRHDAVGDLPAEEALLQRVGGRTAPMLSAKLSTRLVDVHRHACEGRPAVGSRSPSRAAPARCAARSWRETDSPPRCRISTASPVPTGRSMQIVVVSRKRDVDAEVVRQRRLDDLLLDLAVERDGDLLAGVVLPHVDQRVLLGELRERDAQRALVVGVARARRPSPGSAGRSGAASRAVRGLADRVADLDLGEAPELPDLPGGRPTHAGPPRRGRRR